MSSCATAPSAAAAGQGQRPGPAGGEPWRPGRHGLLGMRERAATVGGSLRTGAAPGGGFLVEAALPGQAGGDMTQRRR